MDINDIKKGLESEYDIPFLVLETRDGGEPAFVIGPENKGKELFTLFISFRNKVRLHIEYQPEKYSAEFVNSMSGQPIEDRMRFVEYAHLLQSLGAKIEIEVNGMDLDLTNVTKWTAKWQQIKMHMTKMPVFEDNDDYPSEAYKWGSLFMGMILSLADIVPIHEETIQEGFTEGDLQRTEVNRYERNPLNRKLCLAAKGYDCQICGMNFEKKYGIVGHNFIHVHHIVPVSQVGPGYVIKPLEDLVPVCPNCHAMLHRTDPPLLPEELIELIASMDGE